MAASYTLKSYIYEYIMKNPVIKPLKIQSEGKRWIDDKKLGKNTMAPNVVTIRKFLRRLYFYHQTETAKTMDSILYFIFRIKGRMYFVMKSITTNLCGYLIVH